MVADRDVTYTTSLCFHWILQVNIDVSYVRVVAILAACTYDPLSKVVRVYMRSYFACTCDPPTTGGDPPRGGGDDGRKDEIPPARPCSANTGPGLVGGCSPNRDGPLLKPEDKDGSAGLAPCKAAVPSGTRVT